MNLRRLHNFIMLLCALQALLIILRLSGIIAWPWLLIMIPAWVPVAAIVLITAWIYTYHLILKRKP